MEFPSNEIYKNMSNKIHSFYKPKSHIIMNKISLTIRLITMVSIVIFLTSCGNKEKKIMQQVSMETITQEETEAASKGTADYEKSPESNQSLDEADKKDRTSGEQNKEVIPQKIIKSAEISFKVEKYDNSRGKILEIVKKYQGIVGSENQTGDASRTTNVMQIRVANEKFDALIDELLKEAVFVDFKKIDASDVTEEFIDVNARLKSKKDAMIQYQLILKRANSVDEILDVQQYVRTLQEEIESLEGRLQYLNNKVDLSTITLTFYEEGKILPAQKEGFGYKVREALSYGWQGLVTFFIVLIYLWPLWLVAAVTFFVIRYFVKKARRKRAMKKQS